MSKFGTVTLKRYDEVTPVELWAAWNEEIGFGQLPNAFSDIDDAIADAQCRNILDDRKWIAVKVLMVVK